MQVGTEIYIHLLCPQPTSPLKQYSPQLLVLKVRGHPKTKKKKNREKRKLQKKKKKKKNKKESCRKAKKHVVKRFIGLLRAFLILLLFCESVKWELVNSYTVDAAGNANTAGVPNSPAQAVSWEIGDFFVICSGSTRSAKRNDSTKQRK